MSHKFEYGKMTDQVIVLVDGDWAGDKETRRSTSSGFEFLAEHIVNDYATTQGVVALSSTESEYHAAVLGAGHGLLTRNILRETNYPIKMVVIVSGSTGARGVVMRQGVGKIRHLEARDLWLQDYAKRVRCGWRRSLLMRIARIWGPNT